MLCKKENGAEGTVVGNGVSGLGYELSSHHRPHASRPISSPRPQRLSAIRG